MNLDAFTAYFESLTGTNGIVPNFYPFDETEQTFLGGLKNNPEGQCLVPFVPEMKPTGNNIDAMFDVWECMIWVVDRFNDKGANRNDRLKENRQKTFDSVDAIRKAMFNTARTCHFMKGIVPSSIHIQRVGPTADSYYGWSMSFDIEVNINTYVVSSL